MDACKQQSCVIEEKTPRRKPCPAICVTCVSAAYASGLASSKGGDGVSAELSASPGCCLKSISKPAATLDPRLAAGNCDCGGGGRDTFFSEQGWRRVAKIANKSQLDSIENRLVTNQLHRPSIPDPPNTLALGSDGRGNWNPTRPGKSWSAVCAYRHLLNRSAIRQRFSGWTNRGLAAAWCA